MKMIQAKLELAIKIASATVLLSRSSTLVKASSRRGKAAVAVILFLALSKHSFRIGTKTTLLATLGGLASSVLLKSPKILRWIVAIGSVPVVAEALEGGDADMPAVGAILLGLLLDHCSAAAIILLMVTGGEALEEYALERAGSALHSLLEQNPGVARLANSDAEIPADKVHDGDEVLVKHEEVVPVDGVLIEPERCSVDERLLTGECVSVEKHQGELVMAGSTNGSGVAVKIRAKGKYEDSVLHQMKSSLKAALEKKGKIELVSKRIADSLTPLTVATAAFGLEFALRRRHTSSADAWRVVLSVLMSATPCPAAIGVPIAMLSGMSVSSRVLGATVKSGEALEALSAAKVLVLDKTGTITTGRPIVSQLYFHDNNVELKLGEQTIDMQLALDLVAHVEFQTKHVLADAVVREFRARGGVIKRSLSNFSTSPGLGVRGVIDGVEVRVGSKDYCIEGSSKDAPSFQSHDSSSHLVSYFSLRRGTSVIYGTIAFEDPIREEVAELVRKMAELGMTVVILSGDSSKHLSFVAKTLGISRYYTCLPHEKVKRVRDLQAEFGIVLMVGDGANDSAALAAADVGISVDPSGMASESAKVVLLNGDVLRVLDLIRLSNHVVTIARRTVTWGMFASGVQMMIASTGMSSPFVNAVVQETIDLSATLHALTALNFK